MKSGKLIAGLVLVGVLVFFAMRELKQDQAQGKRRIEELVFPYASTRVADLSFALTEVTKQASWARDASGQWILSTGTEGTDAAIAPELVGAWSRVRFKSVVEEQPSDLARYGLKPPAALLTATLKSTAPGETPQRVTLAIGNPSELEPAFYAQIDGFDRVVLVSVDVADLLGGVGRKAFGLESLIPEATHQQ